MKSKSKTSAIDHVPDLKGADWAAKVYKRHLKVIYYLASKGEIPCVRVGRRVLFNPEAVVEHIRRGGGREAVADLQAGVSGARR